MIKKINKLLKNKTKQYVLRYLELQVCYTAINIYLTTITLIQNHFIGDIMKYNNYLSKCNLSDKN